jgi:anti-anti-sigma regulatory factor
MVAMQSPENRGKLAIEKFSEGTITCLRFKGTIDEKFEGKKLAGTIKAKKLVLDLGQVDKISSFGVREWLSFISTVEKNVQQLVLINCTPKVVNQINMVANFLGKGMVFSFYAPYRCDDCDAEHLVLLNVDRDHESISKMRAPERPCPSCGNPAYLDEDPVTFFARFAQQPQFELDGQITTFLISKLNYAVSELARRIQAEKFLEGRNTYVKVVGNLDATFPGERLAEGLEGTVILDVSGIGGIDPAGATEFRRFMGAVMPSVERIYLIGCQPAFLLRSAQPEDLGGKVQVLSFALPYTCQKCATTATQPLDVAEHFEVLKLSMPPTQKCEVCGGATTCSASGDILSHLPNLPRPEVDGALLKFIKKSQKRKTERPQDRAQKLGARSIAATVIPVTVVALAAIASVTYFQSKHVRTVGDTPSTKRPAWISSATPASGYCTDLSNRTVCVGVSSYLPTKESAKTEASQAALEALANTIGLRIDNPTFRDQVRPVYSDTRKLALADLESVGDDTLSESYDRAIKAARRARKQVAEALQRTGGDAVPAQISDWYWEEYKAVSGEGTEFLVFVRYDVSEAQASALVNRYALHNEVLGGRVLTAFPSLGWRFPDVAEGAMVVGLDKGSPLGAMGLEDRDIVLAVGGERVRDAGELATKLQAQYAAAKGTGQKITFLLKKGDGDPIEHTVAATGGVATTHNAVPQQ